MKITDEIVEVAARAIVRDEFAQIGYHDVAEGQIIKGIEEGLVEGDDIRSNARAALTAAAHHLAAQSSPVVVSMPLDAVLMGWRDGDEKGWHEEFCWIEANHLPRLDMLMTSIQETGIREPILLGDDGRVWDGHHRLCAASKLDLEKVPVTFAAQSSPRPERCDTCHDSGRVPWMVEGDPNVYQERDEEGTISCPDCSPRPERDEVAEALERVLALHVPWYEVSGVRHEQRVIVGWSDAPKGHICVIGAGSDVCDPDETHAVLACSECRVAVPDYEYGLSFWPCPTVRAAALDGEEGS